MRTHIFSKSSDSHIHFYILVLHMCINDVMTLFHNHYLIMAVPITSSSSQPASQPLTDTSVNALYVEIDAEYTKGNKALPLYFSDIF